MAFYWITSKADEGLGCVRTSAPSGRSAGDEALRIAAALLDRCDIDAHPLPYPAKPFINDMQGHPDFCSTPDTCKGRTSCPHSYACSE